MQYLFGTLKLHFVEVIDIIFAFIPSSNSLTDGSVDSGDTHISGHSNLVMLDHSSVIFLMVQVRLNRRR